MQKNMKTTFLFLSSALLFLCCDGEVDEGVETTFYTDTDGDGYGDSNSAVTVDACDAPSGYVTDNTDCDDTNAAVNPAASEVCNDIDDNCDGQVDEGVQTTFYADNDEDGYGNSSDAIDACDTPSGYVTDNTDCDDTDAGVNPGASEVCNGIDDNCDGQVNEGITVCCSNTEEVHNELDDGCTATEPTCVFENGSSPGLNEFSTKCSYLAPLTLFTTSSKYTGNIGGQSGADDICATHAANGGLAGTYFAWISTSNDDDPESRFNRSPLPYYTPDGVLVANDWDDLTDGDALSSTHLINEYGNPRGTDGGIMTSTKGNGQAQLAYGTCLGYTSDSDDYNSAGTGQDDKLTINALINCVTTRHTILCVEQ